MKLRPSPYWLAAGSILISFAFRARGFSLPVTCRPQMLGPQVCTSQGTAWLWAANAIFALGVVIAVGVLARRLLLLHHHREI